MWRRQGSGGVIKSLKAKRHSLICRLSRCAPTWKTSERERPVEPVPRYKMKRAMPLLSLVAYAVLLSTSGGSFCVEIGWPPYCWVTKSWPLTVSPVVGTARAWTRTPLNADPDEIRTWTFMRKGSPTRTLRGGTVSTAMEVGLDSIVSACGVEGGAKPVSRARRHYLSAQRSTSPSLHTLSS